MQLYDEAGKIGPPSQPSMGSTQSAHQWDSFRLICESATKQLSHPIWQRAVKPGSIPELSAAGATLRNAWLIASALLLVLTKREIWFKQTVLLACLVYAHIFTLHLYAHTPDEGSLTFTILFEADSGAKGSIFAQAPPHIEPSAIRSESEISEQKTVRSTEILLEVLRKWDLSVRDALTAIKEAEVVGRGFKL